MSSLSAFASWSKSSVLVFVVAAIAVLAVTPAAATLPNTYVVTRLVSDNGMPSTPVVDPHLVNAWGLVSGPTTPWWVNDNGADRATLYTAAGTKVPVEVTLPPGPTGIVFNGDSTSFLVQVGTSNFPARFIFATESGMIAGWPFTTPLLSAAQVEVDSSGAHAIYKGLTIATTPSGPQLYATDFHNAKIDVFDGSWAPVPTSGGFVDSSLPAGYAPFGIQAIGTRIFVTFALQAPGAMDEIDGPSLGFVDAFDTAGNMLARVAMRGLLNAPWGLALAPSTVGSNFGFFSGDLLVGNFGDGHISAYQEVSPGVFELQGPLRGTNGMRITIDGLWALQFGHGASANGLTNTLFFTAGPNDEADGLFGTITAAT